MHWCKIHSCKKTGIESSSCFLFYFFGLPLFQMVSPHRIMNVRQLPLLWRQFHTVTIWFPFIHSFILVFSCHISSPGWRPGEFSFNSAEERTSLWTVTFKAPLTLKLIRLVLQGLPHELRFTFYLFNLMHRSHLNKLFCKKMYYLSYIFKKKEDIQSRIYNAHLLTSLLVNHHHRLPRHLTTML